MEFHVPKRRKLKCTQFRHDQGECLQWQTFCQCKLYSNTLGVFFRRLLKAANTGCEMPHHLLSLLHRFPLQTAHRLVFLSWKLRGVVKQCSFVQPNLSTCSRCGFLHQKVALGEEVSMPDRARDLPLLRSKLFSRMGKFGHHAQGWFCRIGKKKMPPLEECLFGQCVDSQ